jgi:dipeptidase
MRQTADCYQVYDPGHYSDRSARWVIDFVDNLAGLCFQKAIEDIRAVRDPWEEQIFARQAQVEAEALRLYKEDPAKARDYLTRYCQGLEEEVPRMFLQLRDTLISKYTNDRE